MADRLVSEGDGTATLQCILMATSSLMRLDTKVFQMKITLKFPLRHLELLLQNLHLILQVFNCSILADNFAVSEV